MDLMLQAGPEVHGNRPDLYLHLRIHRAVRQIDRNTDDHMIAFIATGFGIRNVILHSDHLNILLIPDHIRNAVNVRCKGTDDADASNIVYVFYHVIYGGFLPVAFELFHNAFRGLDPCLDVFDGIVLVYMLKLVVQNLHLCLHLTQCGAVYQRDLLPAVDSIPVFYLKLHITSQSLLSQKALRPFFIFVTSVDAFSLRKFCIRTLIYMIIIAYLLLKMYNFNKTFIIF